MNDTVESKPTPGGLFAQLAPMAAERTILMTVSMTDGGALCVNFVPKRLKPSEDEALLSALSVTGTPDELDRDLISHIRGYVASHLALSSNLAEVQREMDEAAKRTRQEARKRVNKTVNRPADDVGGVVAEPKGASGPEGTRPVTREPLTLFDEPERSLT